MTNSQSHLLESFVTQLKTNEAKVIICDQTELSALINDFFEDNKLPKSLLTNVNLNLDDINIISGAATGDERTGLSKAVGGISETGTLILESSSENPTSINFLVDHHLVLINDCDIVENLHLAMTKLEARSSWNKRAINFISGPSRTADIEQTIQLGAHGPRNLVVFIIND